MSHRKRPQDLVHELEDLVSFPPAAARIIELADDPESVASDLAEALSTDPALAARVLRVANSAYYSLGAPVDSIDRAVSVLGRRRVRDLVVGVSAVYAFENCPIDGAVLREFWSHSVCCGVLAAEIARVGRPRLTESAFCAGLLHDLGELVLRMRAPDAARRVLQDVAASNGSLTIAEAEQSVLGYSHMEVGEALAHQWRLPRSLAESLAYHHRPLAAGAFRELVGTVHIANSLAVLVEHDSVDLSEAPPVELAAWPMAGVSRGDALRCVARAKAEFFAMVEVLRAPQQERRA
jgi:HD-like signal output (HDOD) protein